MSASVCSDEIPDVQETAPRARETNVKETGINGSVIATYQLAEPERVDGQRVQGEANGQVLLEANWRLGLGHWHAEIRAGTTPRSDGVSAAFPEANATIGETLDSDGDGRVAVTQLFYDFDFGPRSLVVGLIDPTYFLDANDVANNEYRQFLGASFVNNPTVDFPSFALAATYNERRTENLQFRLHLSSSSGLEDPDDPTYGNVFAPGGDGKGVFGVGELQWVQSALEGHLGAWVNTSESPLLDAPSRDQDNYGAYGNVIGPLGAGQWNLRVGIARESVSPAANFVGLTMSYPLGRASFAVGVSRTGASSDLPATRAAFVQAEAYVRVRVTDNLYITPDIQYLDNSGFDPNDGDGWLAGVRLGTEF